MIKGKITTKELEEVGVEDMTVWLKTRGYIKFHVENHHIDGEEIWYHTMSSYEYCEPDSPAYAGMIPIWKVSSLMEEHGFFTKKEDYDEWKQMDTDRNYCKCCGQSKPYSNSRFDSGKEVYLKRHKEKSK